MQFKSCCFPRFKRCSGSSLLEVLVTMVILSIGLLGYAGMQLSSMRSTEMGRMRSEVIALASDISDRLKANHDEALQGSYDGNLAEKIPAQPGCSAQACSPQEISRHDMSSWYQRLSTLPAGSGAIAKTGISINGIDSTLMTISVCWSEKRDAVQDSSCPPRSDNLLQLFQLRVLL